MGVSACEFYAYECIHVCVCERVHAFLCVCTSVCIHVCVCVCVHELACVSFGYGGRAGV